MLYWNRSSGFWQEVHLSFLYRYLGKISTHHAPPPPPPAPPPPAHTPHPPCHVFWQIMTAWTILVEGHQGNISAVILKSVQWFLTRRFLKFSIQIYRENKPRPWRPHFLKNSNGLNNLGRESLKEHFRKIILKSVQWFLTRRFFKFLVKKSIFISSDLDMQWTVTIWTTLKEDQPRIILVKFGQNPISHLGDVVWRNFIFTQIIFWKRKCSCVAGRKLSKTDKICPLAIPIKISAISIHKSSLVKIHSFLCSATKSCKDIMLYPPKFWVPICPSATCSNLVSHGWLLCAS